MKKRTLPRKRTSEQIRQKKREEKCNKNEKEVVTKKRMNRKKVKAQSDEVGLPMKSRLTLTILESN